MRRPAPPRSVPASSASAGTPSAASARQPACVELFVDPLVQPGQAGVDDPEHLVEVGLGAVIRVLDVQRVRTGTRIEGPQHPQPVVRYPEVDEDALMVA